MVQIVFTGASVLIAIIFLLKNRNRRLVSDEISRGRVCYKCKFIIEDYQNKGPVMCVSCTRDSKLENVLNKKWMVKSNFLFRDLSKVAIALNFISFCLNLLSIFYKPVQPYASIFLFIGMSIFYWNYRLISKEKTQSD